MILTQELENLIDDINNQTERICDLNLGHKVDGFEIIRLKEFCKRFLQNEQIKIIGQLPKLKR